MDIQGIKCDDWGWIWLAQD